MERNAQPTQRVFPTQQAEQQLRQLGFEWIAGCDEVGRGCLAGPLVSAAVILPPHTNLVGLADSKLLSPTKRQKLAVQITRQSIAWGIGMVSAWELDRVGMTCGTHQAFDRALVHLRHRIDFILVDGQGFSFPTTPFSCVINGDQHIAVIAAASIVAKVYRDHLMTFMEQLFPGYGFKQHKGYGTAMHQEQLRRLGPCTIHRRLFAPVREVAKASQL